MHKQHEDQPSNELPNLSTWHRLELGAVIPKGVPYACTYDGSSSVVIELDGYRVAIVARADGGITYYTERPIAPPLPTEEGATIMASSGDWPPSALLTREGDRWVTCYGDEWAVDDIRSWAPVTIGETVVVRP